jgi:murein DD-endopeptidase MepM/ murein hydrolase activator NlpD
MKKKNYSVIIVSDATSTNKEFVISSALIRNSIIGLTVLLLIFGYVIFDYLTISFNKEVMKRLERDNISKERTITELTRDIKYINSSIKRMEVLKDRILVMAGLTSPYALKGVGGGGPIGNIVSDIEMKNTNLTLKEASPQQNIIDEVKGIATSAKKIEKSLRFVKGHINEQKIRLAHTPSLWPTRGYLTDVFGMRTHPITGKRSHHNGLDISTQHGNPVYAPADGVIITSEHRQYYGNLIIIDHRFNYTTYYGHLASFNIKEGDRVKRGDVIGFVGNTGRSNAPHLHYEVRFIGKPQNPMNYILD